jgi:hypothetical protein
VWLIALVTMPACASFPKAAPLPMPHLDMRETSARVVFLPTCEVACPEDAAFYCSERLNALYNALVATGLFREVVVGQEPVGEGNYEIDLHDFPRRPYWSTPAHNPGFLLLALAIPFWWEEPLGYHFSIRELPDGEARVVDTRWRGTVVMWSLASVINVFPGRTFHPASTQDVERLRVALTGS